MAITRINPISVPANAEVKGSTGGDLNDMLPGEAWWGSNFTNAPGNSTNWFMISRQGDYQTAYGFNGNAGAPIMHLRSHVNSVWQPWVRLDNAASVPLSGDVTMTGGISMNNSPIDRDGANPSSVQYGQMSIFYVDKDGELIGYIQPKRMADGRIGLQLTAVNENTSGKNIYNTFSLYASKDGAYTYELTSPGNFRSAIGLTTSTYSSLANTGVTITANSGYTIAVSSVKRYGNIVSLAGSISCTSAIASGATFNPFQTNVGPAVISSDWWVGFAAMGSTGKAWVRAEAAVAANTAHAFTMMGIL